MWTGGGWVGRRVGERVGVGSQHTTWDHHQPTSDMPFKLHFLLVGHWSPEFVCLMRIAHGGIRPFTDVHFGTLWLIKISINRLDVAARKMKICEINLFLNKI